MKAWIKAVVGITLSLMFLFTSVGYAALTSGLSANGIVNLIPRDGLYIISVEEYSANNVTSSNITYFDPTNLDVTFNSSARNSSITYKITVFNNTDYKYTYSGIVFSSDLSGYNGNQYINSTLGMSVTTKENPDDSSATFNTSDSIEPRSSRTFYATYTNGWRVPRNQNLKTLINYKFGVNVDSVSGVIVERTFELFENILNDTSSGGKYEYLTDIIDDKYTGGGSGNQWMATYIGNVTGSTDTDTQKVTNLFGGENLSLTIDNVQTNVTLLIKREDVDGNTNTGDSYSTGSGNNYISAQGCEMTLYLTTDKLDRAGSNPTVYAAVFTCDRNDDGTLGEWYMLGDMYTGTAPVLSYDGNWDGTGSFHTDSWVSSRNTYQVVSGYSYTVNANLTIKDIMQIKDQTATNKLQELLDRSTEIVNSGQYAGSAVTELQAAITRASTCYTTGSDGSLTVNSSATRAQLIPHIKDLDAKLKAFS